MLREDVHSQPAPLAIKPEGATTRLVPPPRARAGRLGGATGDCFLCKVGLPVVVMVMVPTIADRHRYDARLSSHRHSQEQHQDLQISHQGAPPQRIIGVRVVSIPRSEATPALPTGRSIAPAPTVVRRYNDPTRLRKADSPSTRVARRRPAARRRSRATDRIRSE